MSRPPKKAAAPKPRRSAAAAAPTVDTAWVIAAVVIVAIGVFPGPWIVGRLDPSLATDGAMGQFIRTRWFWLGGALLIVGPAIALSAVLEDRVDRFLSRVWSGAAAHERRVAWMLATTCVLLSVVAAVVAYSRSATTSDEIAQLWHARILLTGRLTLPVDPNPEFFAVDNVIDFGRWYSQFPIGGPAVLALGLAARAVWLVNPILAGLTVINVWRFASRAFDARTAIVSAAATALCPFVVLMSGSQMNHTPVLYFVSVALAALPDLVGDATDTARLRSGALFGLALALAFAIRPLDAVIAAAVLGGFWIVRRRDAVGGSIRPLSAAAVAGLLPTAILMVINARTNGSPTRFGYEILWGANHSLGFHVDPYGHLHTATRGAQLVVRYLMQLDWALFEWPIPGLLVVAAGLVLTRKRRDWDLLLCVWIVAQTAAYGAYWHAGQFAGPRYLFTSVPAFVILSARGLVALWDRLDQPKRRAFALAALAATVVTWTVPMSPYGAAGEIATTGRIRKAFRVDVEDALSPIQGKPALVFVPEQTTSMMTRRLVGLGLSRPDIVALLANADGCALFDAMREEERVSGAAADRLARLQRIRRYEPTPKYRILAADMNFHISDSASMTPTCRAQLRADASRADPLAYGRFLLRNPIDGQGRIAGPTIFVADLAEHNEVLRARFGDRPWYRLMIPLGAADSLPRLIDYR